MVKVGDRVTVWNGVVGVVEHVSNRFELRPYTHLVAFADGSAWVFSEDEIEVIPDGR